MGIGPFGRNRVLDMDFMKASLIVRSQVNVQRDPRRRAGFGPTTFALLAVVLLGCGHLPFDSSMDCIFVGHVNDYDVWKCDMGDDWCYVNTKGGISCVPK